MSIAIYRRVSTTDQDVAAQDHAVQAWLSKHYPDAKPRVFEDVGISGKHDARPGFQALCEAVRSGEIKTVVVYRLDRLSRNAVTAMKLLIEWIGAGVEFFATEQPILQLGKGNPFRLTFCSLMAEVAELERETIVARVKSGMAAAKARGIHTGRKSRLDEATKHQIKALRNHGKTYAEIGQILGISSGLAHYIATK